MLLALAVPCFPQSLETLLSQGRAAFRAGQYPAAVSIYRQATTRADGPRKQAEEAGYMLGLSLLRAGEWDDSFDSFAAFASRFPDSRWKHRVSYWMAAASLKRGRPQDALTFLREAADAPAGDPYRAAALLLEGIAGEAAGDGGAAATAYRALLDGQAPKRLRAEAIYRLAGIEYHAGRFESARDLYGRIILESGSPFVREALFFLAESEMALANPGEAERRLRTLLSVYPDSPYRDRAALLLAEAAWRQGDDARALALLDAELSAGRSQGSVLLLQADIRLSRREYAPATRGYQSALESLPEGTERSRAWYSLGISQLASGDPDSARQSFGKAAEGPPGDVAEHAAWQGALLFARAGRVREAARAFGELLARFPGSSRGEQATRILAELLEESGDMPAALARWNALVDGFGGSAAFAQYLFRRGAALLALGRTAPALDDFQTLLMTYPGSPWAAEASYRAGYLYTRRGEYPRALTFFRDAARTALQGDTVERSLLAAAICLFDMGSFDAAISAFQDLRGRAPRNVSEGRVVLYIGKALYRTGRLEPAARTLREATGFLAARGSDETADAGPDAWYWLAWSLFRLGRVVDSRDAFLTLASTWRNDPRRPEALLRAGLCETARGDNASALPILDRAIAAGREMPDAAVLEQAMYEKGWALSRAGRAAESAEAFDLLEREFPGGRLAPEAFFRLAEDAFQAGRFGDARGGFERVARHFPGSPLAPRALYWSAEAARRGGDPRGSLDLFWACLQGSPEPGLVLLALDGYRDAILAVDDAVTAKSYADRAGEARGLPAEALAALQLDYAMLLIASSAEDARAVIRAVQEQVPPEPIAGEASLLIGMCDAASADWSHAIAIFQSLERSRADGVGARALLQHAAALVATGLTAEAIDLYLAMPARFPDMKDFGAEAFFRAIQVARARGDPRRAAVIEQELRAHYPGSPWIDRQYP